MNKKLNHSFLVLLFLIVPLMITSWSTQLQSQEKYPTRAIDIICPFAAGGATDIYARFAADSLRKKWDVPLNVINKTGGNTIPGNIELYNSKPDGYTVMADCNSSSSLLEAGARDKPFKVMDRTFIAIIAISQNVFYVPSNSPIKTMKDLEAEIKKAPEQFTWASWGTGSYTDYGARLFFKSIGIDVSKTKPVMSRGTGEATSLVAGGHVKLGIGTAVSVYPVIKAETVRAIGMTGLRHPDYPGVATMEEQGYPTVKWVYWMGFSGPPKLSSYVIDKWNEALKEISKDPEYSSRLIKAGGVPHYLNSTQARDYVMKEFEETAYLWGLK